ncbi:hypothetical protein N7520_004920 [Penicillium odoratum]|uniref:uncharacterized protein n=1 Tax=Penicillium odoratum TaxID=1167516 RepID=UPI0025469CEC|nr:uncharacterized protein N7520_004920 [Penicillium odoratum]KAJ5765361.1 hypothetical protein N7520_004920 [Penicillium odoratum]
MSTYRPAELSDLPQIRAINAHYITNTSLTFMTTPPPLETYIAKWHDLKSRGLPFLVAVQETQTKSDKTVIILGYASFSSFRGHLLSYGPTVELSLFVHPDYQSRSIGSALLDSLLDMIRCKTVHHKVEEALLDESGNVDLNGGEAIVVRNVMAVMAVDPEGKDGGEALRRWYCERGFVEKGRLEKVGFKRGYWIDTIYLQFSTLT